MSEQIVEIKNIDVKDEKYPLFLVEFHGDVTSTVAYSKSGKEYDMHGLKVYRIIDRDCQILAKYDQIKDQIDTSPLAIKDARIVFVASEDGKTLHWFKAGISAWDDLKREFAITKYEKCDPTEIEYLNKIYPGFYENSKLE